MQSAKVETFVKAVNDPKGWKALDIVFPSDTRGRNKKVHKREVKLLGDRLRPVAMSSSLGFVSEPLTHGHMHFLKVSFMDQGADNETLMNQAVQVLTPFIEEFPIFENGLAKDQLPFWAFREDNNKTLATGMFGEGLFQVIDLCVADRTIRSIKPFTSLAAVSPVLPTTN